MWRRGAALRRVGVGRGAATARRVPPQQVFRALRLRRFDAAELRTVFDRLDADARGSVTARDLERGAFPGDPEAAAVLLDRYDDDGDGALSFDEFEKHVTRDASRRDARIWPIAGTMFLGGISVGAVMPVMPALVTDLGLSPADYGVVVGCFGLAKLVGNAPAARLVESRGRRPLIAGGLGLIALGFGAVGAADGVGGLAAARLVTGVGVAALVTGSSMAAADLSTPLNRASTAAPLGAAFSAGTVCGPALGGALASRLDPSTTFFAIGGLVALDAVLAWAAIRDTRDVRAEEPPARAPSMLADARAAWRDVPEIRRLCLANVTYWMAAAGANMTVLPLVLAGPPLAFAPATIGTLFAGQAAIALVAAAPVAALADRVGPARLVPPALVVAGAAYAAFPAAAAHGYEGVAAAMAVSAVGGALLGSAPTAAATNAAPAERRAAALALLRASGDVGLLAGAATLGSVAAAAGTDAAFGGAALACVATAAAVRAPPPR